MNASKYIQMNVSKSGGGLRRPHGNLAIGISNLDVDHIGRPI